MPSKYVHFSQEAFDEICERIANGESLRSICASDGMPNKASVFRWMAGEEAQPLRDQYARARDAQADTLFDEILDIADDASGDLIETEDGGTRLNAEHVQRSRLRIDARKWMAGKLRPKVYGDRLELDGKVGLTVTLESDADKL